MAFKLNGAALQDALSLTQRIKLLLDKLPFEELITTQELAKALKMHPGSRPCRLANPHLVGYGYMLSTCSVVRTVWGSKKTIQALIQQLQENSNAD